MHTRKTNALKGKIMRDRDANLGQHKLIYVMRGLYGEYDRTEIKLN